MERQEAEASRIRGMKLYSSEDDELGEIDDVFLDDQTGRPEWVRLGVGLFGWKNVLVPLEPLQRKDGGLRAPYSKAMIRDAPRVEESYVSPDQETALYPYYGLDAASPSELNEMRGSPGDPIQQGPPVLHEAGEAPAFIDSEAGETIVPERDSEANRIRLRRWVQT